MCSPRRARITERDRLADEDEAEADLSADVVDVLEGEEDEEKAEDH